MKTQQKTTSGWGGKREGAGKKPIYEEPTTNVTFRVPISHKEYVRKIVREYLDGLKYAAKSKKQEPEYGC